MSRRRPPRTPGPGRAADALWLVRSAQPLLWSINGRFVAGKAGPVPDRCLQPIRGPGDAGTLARARQQDLFEAVF
ncbi:MAG TPA: hypothetical protein VLJ58_14045 [Ramlibacter sp.]|nr:hypothetical protein [Ramlibacter sp.]